MDCEGREPTVWYDAMTESVYENALQWDGSINLENLSEELEEIMTEVSSSTSEAEDYERDIQYFKGILEKLLTNLTLIVRDIKLNLEIDDEVSVEAHIESISLSDMTEEVRSREPFDVGSNESILLSKRVLIGPISVDIKHENQTWKLIECTEADSTAAMTGEMNLFKSGHCEVLVKTGNLSAFLAPDHIKITDSILQAFTKGKREEDASSSTSRNIIGGTKFSIGFIKVSIENMTLILSESPLFYDGSSNAAVYEINFEACELITFPSSDQPGSISFSSLKYSLEEDGKVLSESHLQPALQVCVDEKGLQIYVKDRVELKVDQGVWSLAQSFLKLRRQKDDSADGEGSGGLPFILQCPALKLLIDGVLLERTDAIEASLTNAIFSGNGKSSSFSFESSDMAAGRTKIETGATTISKSLFDVEEGTVEVSPFDPLYSSIEGERFVNIASFDKACALQDRIQLCTRKHNIVSSRSIAIETIDSDIVWLKSLFKRLSGIRSNAQAKNSRSASKFICGSLKLDIQICNVSYSVSISEIVQFMANLPDQSVRVSDFRADLDYLTRDGEVLGKKILTLSLDGSVKGFVLTEERKPGEKPLIAGQISGIEFIVPISLDLSSELKFLDDLVGSDVLLPPRDQRGLHFDGHFNLFKCSVTPSFPSSWPKCHASSVYSNAIRMIVNSKEHLRLYQQLGVLFVSKRSSDCNDVPGIYGDGHSYWQEKGYAPICEIDFLQVHLERLAGYLQLTLENQAVLVELCEDSAMVAKNYFNYLSNIPRYAAMGSKRASAAPPEATPKKEEEPKDLLEDVDERMFMGPLNEHAEEAGEDTAGEGPPVVKKFSQLDIEENFFSKPTIREDDAYDEEIVEGDFACVQPSNDWEALIELPINPKPNDETLVVRSNDSVLVFGSSHSPQDAVHVKTDGAELEIDEDYFSRPVVGKDSFPFSGEPFLGSFRLKLVDFSVSIKLVDGHGFSRRHPQSAEATPLMHSFGMSPLSPAALSTAPSARWSESATRPAEDAVEMVLDRINCEVDWGQLGQEDGPTEQLMHEDGTAGGPEGGLMALRLVIRKVEILDQVRASRWKTILTRRLAEEEESPLRDELGGLLEESMVRCELSAVQVAGPEEALRAEDRVEYRLKVRLLPLRVHLDQDALRFASRFLSSFAAADGLIDEPDQVQVEPLFFQHCDIAEIRVRLDYKPKRVDLCRVALGRFAELLNLFQLEDAELALPAVRLRGVKGARQFTADLVRAWLPFVKGRQIPRMLHGIGPVRTVVNLGSGLSDLILLPMHHYQRDGRLIRGLRKGASSFLHATALEGARLGSRLAVGTQVVLEHVDDIFEGSSSDAPPHGEQRRLAGQPEDVREGLLEAYQSLATSLEGALQTIVAVPVQVYERSGPSGALKAVIRAVPIAVLRPMIGASEAVGRTLMGIENSMDASRGVEIGQKYKRAG